MVKRIRFDIDSDGEVSVNVECAQGSECEVLTRPFEESLGIVSDKSYKDSYYMTSIETESSELNYEK